MRLGWIDLLHFRSYDRVRFEPAGGVNVLVGPNGAGKTNLLESIGYLATLRSFRGVTDEALIADGAEEAVLRGEVVSDRGTARIELELARTRRRRILVNGSRPSRAAELRGYVRVVTFLPDDIDMVKRGPALRRDLLDDAAVQMWPAAAAEQSDYERAVAQRNALLRSGRVDRFTLQVWNDRVAHAGAKLMERRRAAAQILMRHTPATYAAIAGSGTSVDLEYRSTWGGGLDETTGLADVLAEALEAAERTDRERRQTTVGPHRDEPRFLLGGRGAREASSQGEQRTLALSLRLAELHAVAEVAGEPPILLLDDVFSELDAGRSKALAAALPQTQTFVTTARIEDVPLEGRRWEVGEGAVI